MNSLIRQRACPVCLETESELVFESRLPLPSGHPLVGSIREVECIACGMVYVDVVGTEEAYARYYERLSKYDCVDTASGTGLKPYEDVRFAAVVRRVTHYLGSKNARIVDIGCASGGLLRAFLRAGYKNCCGVDASSACVRAVKEQLGVDAWVASATSLPRELSSAEGAVVSHVLEHLVDPGQALEEIGGRLPEGCPIYVEVPDAGRYVDFLNAPFQDFNPEHINHFSLQILTTLLERKGFEPLECGQGVIEIAPDQGYPMLFVVARRTQRKKQEVTRDRLLGQRIREYVTRSKGLLRAMSEAIDAAVPDGAPLVVWGAGSLALRLLADSNLSKKRILGFVDSNPALQGWELGGVPVLSPSVVSQFREVPILIASSIHEAAIREDIREKWALANPLVGLRIVADAVRSGRAGASE